MAWIGKYILDENGKPKKASTKALGMLEGWNKDIAELERIFATPKWQKR